MSFAALKNIPCPKGNSCTAFQCLFGHDKDKDQPAATGSSSSSSSSPQAATTTTRRHTPDHLDTDTASQAQGPPRKRQRTEIRQAQVQVQVQGVGSSSTSSAGTASASKTPSKPVTASRTPDGSLATQADARTSSNSPPSAKHHKARPLPPSSSTPSAPTTSPSLSVISRPSPKTHTGPATPSSFSRPPFTPRYTDTKPSPIHTSVASSTIPSSTTIATTSSATPNIPPSPSPAPSSATTSATTASTPAPAPPIPRKAESLNPRFVPKAPSSYETRFKLVKLLHAELARLNSALKKDLEALSKDEASPKGLVLSDQQLIWDALDLEERAAVDKPSIYNNVLRNLIMQYKRMTVKQWRDERVVVRDQKAAAHAHSHNHPRPPKQQHHSNLNSRQQQQPQQQQQPKKIVTGLTPQQEVKMLSYLITPIDKLSQHGYVSTAPTEEEIQKAREGLEAAQGWEKCDRCTKRFQVFPERRGEDGSLTTGGKCNYHWGKTYIPERQPGDRTRVPKRYRCCGQEVGDSAGCTDSPHHVFKATDPKRLATVLNFANTPANPSAPAVDGAVCFDCEMCYTVNGLELVRLTATAWPSGQELLDTLVLPVGQILDLNSRFSGVWPDDLAKAVPWSDKDTARLRTPLQTSKKSPAPQSPRKDQPMRVVGSPQVARDLLFSLITPETPLIGHGLENDLNSVRIIHPTIIDTVLLHPHKHGLPFRYGLKMLMDTLLNRKIQVETDGKVQGHDSAEDARAAGELVLLKVMEKWQEMRFNRWTLDKKTGEFVEPPDLAAPGLTVEFLEAAT